MGQGPEVRNCSVQSKNQSLAHGWRGVWLKVKLKRKPRPEGTCPTLDTFQVSPAEGNQSRARCGVWRGGQRGGL